MPMYIGIDLGGTKIAAGLADASGKLLSKKIIPTVKTADPIVILEQLRDCILDLAKSTKKKVRAVGIGLPGQINKGVVINMPNIPALKDFPLIKRLEKDFRTIVLLLIMMPMLRLWLSIYMGPGKNIKILSM